MSNKSNIEEFLHKAKSMHGEKYNYSLVEYTHYATKIKIICNSCNTTFEQTPVGHLNIKIKEHCKTCSLKNRSFNRLTTSEFIKKSKKLHGDAYDYSLVEYKHSRKKITIICKTCNKIFKQTPSCHLCGNKCPHCDFKNRHISQNDFISRSMAIHGNTYDYSNSKYVNMHTKLEIICNECGKSFNQTPRGHINNRSGCPSCKFSHGEKKVSLLLDFLDIKYVSQYKFDDCKSNRNNKLAFDFYIPSLNMCIEYDGEQHFDINNKWYNPIVKENDDIKNQYCKYNGIKILRISYKEFHNIETILNSIFLPS